MMETEEALNIGEQLRNARLKQGKTLSDVSKDLCIRKIYLEAIEKLDYQNLAPVPYGIGFVRSYAEYLGLNSELAVQAYKTMAKSEDENSIDNNDEDSENVESVPGMRHMVLGMIGLIVVFAIWKGLPLFNAEDDLQNEQEIVVENAIPEPVIIEETENDGQTLSEIGMEDMSVSGSEDEAEAEVKGEENISKIKTENVSVKEKTEIKSETEVKEKTKVKAETEFKTEEQAKNPTPTTVRMVLAGPSWVEIRQGEKILVSGIKNKGYVYDIPDEKGIVVSVGRYYNVDFYVSGRLTKIASSMKQMNIKLDKYIKNNK